MDKKIPLESKAKMKEKASAKNTKKKKMKKSQCMYIKEIKRLLARSFFFFFFSFSAAMHSTGGVGKGRQKNSQLENVYYTGLSILELKLHDSQVRVCESSLVKLE